MSSVISHLEHKVSQKFSTFFVSNPQPPTSPTPSVHSVYSVVTKILPLNKTTLRARGDSPQPKENLPLFDFDSRLRLKKTTLRARPLAVPSGSPLARLPSEAELLRRIVWYAAGYPIPVFFNVCVGFMERQNSPSAFVSAIILIKMLYQLRYIFIRLQCVHQ